jgi:hypothetical protein
VLGYGFNSGDSSARFHLSADPQLSTIDSELTVKVKVILRPMFSRPVYLGSRPPSRNRDQFSFLFSLDIHILTVAGLLLRGALSDERSGL